MALGLLHRGSFDKLEYDVTSKEEGEPENSVEKNQIDEVANELFAASLPYRQRENIFNSGIDIDKTRALDDSSASMTTFTNPKSNRRKMFMKKITAIYPINDDKDSKHNKFK